jgi:protein involved in polysaccharide export with SLBB domain
MRTISFPFVLLLIIITLTAGLKAQNVRSVDPKSMPDSEVKKVEEAIKNSGMSFEDAAQLARQRGASEQQIRDMQQRLQQGTSPASPQGSGTESFSNEPAFETEVLSTRNILAKETSPLFGSYLFNSKNLTFEPSVNVQTPKNYEIGIGDQIIVSIWGNSQNNYQLTVNANGQIMVPDVGPVYLAGLTFGEAENRIRQRLSGIYADMNGSNPRTFAQVSMGGLRSIKVDLVGEVTVPGTYTLPATSTVFNALYLSGGPNDIGSFRTINIIRNNEVIKSVDVYNFLMDARISENIQLQNEDLLFVPVARKKVSVSGEFRRNGIFEMKADENMEDLIRFAGGFTENAWWSNIKIHRKTMSGRTIIDVPFDKAKTVVLEDGDLVTTGKLNELYKNRVTISGPVFQPGEYAWQQGMTIMDLIVKADSLKGDAFTNRGNIIRLNPDYTTASIPFNLGAVLAGRSSILLQPEDIVLIRSKFDMAEDPFITVSGEVLNAGRLDYSDNLTLEDAIFRAGGFTEAADSSFIEVARRLSYAEASSLSDDLVHIYTFNLSRDLKLSDENGSFVLHPFDRISVRRAPGFRESASVMISGEVKYAGRYAIKNRNHRISDLIAMAGGLTNQSFTQGATLSRQSEELGNEFVAIHLDRIMKNPGGKNDLILRNGDELHIPEFMQTVKISGSVQNPFSVTYEEGKNLKYYIDRSGGFKTEAMKRKTYVRYPNGSTATTKNFIVKNYPEVMPGSQIIVPEKPVKEGMATGQWLGIAGTFSSIAIAIAAIFR